METLPWRDALAGGLDSHRPHLLSTKTIDNVRYTGALLLLCNIRLKLGGLFRKLYMRRAVTGGFLFLGSVKPQDYDYGLQVPKVM